MFKRLYSTQSSSLVGTTRNFAERLTSAAQSAWFYSKVAGEIGKYVWQKEALSPPSFAQVQHSLAGAYKSASTVRASVAANPANAVDYVRNLSRADLIRGGAALVQLAGIFSLGEMVGRWHVYGYKQEAVHA